jgi:hypothetical protein
MKMIISRRIGGLELSRAILEELLTRFPAVFDEPIASAEVLPGIEAALFRPFSWVVEREDHCFFLKLNSPELRTLPWLVEQVESRGATVGPDLTVMDLPDDEGWTIIEDDDTGRDILLRASEVARSFAA